MTTKRAQDRSVSADIAAAVRAYYQAILGSELHSLSQWIFFPFCYVDEGTISIIEDEAALLHWWQMLMKRVRAESDFASGQIRDMQATRLNGHSAVVKLSSARLDSNGKVISEQNTFFLLYLHDGSWRVSAVFPNASA